MRGIRVIWIAAILLGLSGCSSSDVAPGPTASKPPIIGTNSTEIPGHIEWSDCRDGAIAAIDGPSHVYEGSRPPGWDGELLIPVNTIQVLVMECQRVSWGTFERGPVFMVQEWHGNFGTIPDACRDGGDYDILTFLESIWFSDPDLTTYAKATYGLPAHLGDFTFEKITKGEVIDWKWTWNEVGGVPSELTYHDFAGASNSSGPVTHRVFWFNGLGISYMDFERNYESDALGFQAASGAFEPPMMYGREGPTSIYPLTGANLMLNAHAGAEISRFSDLQCKVPA